MQIRQVQIAPTFAEFGLFLPGGAGCGRAKVDEALENVRSEPRGCRAQSDGDYVDSDASRHFMWVTLAKQSLIYQRAFMDYLNAIEPTECTESLLPWDRDRFERHRRHQRQEAGTELALEATAPTAWWC